MKKDRKWASIGGQDDELRNTTVQRLGGLVGSLLKLAIVSRLLDKIEDLLREGLISLGPCGGVVFGHGGFGSVCEVGGR